MTIEIPLTRGKVALIDDDDLPLVSGRKWQLNNAGYAVISTLTSGRRIITFMHRLIANVPDGMDTDHIDGNKLNNQKSNLRVATRQENCRNRKRRSNNMSGFKGVTWSNKSRKWVATIWLSGHKHLYCGTFANPADAAHAYDNAARQHFGEFARTNF